LLLCRRGSVPSRHPEGGLARAWCRRALNEGSGPPPEG
jgi:hypothetical protein